MPIYSTTIKDCLNSPVLCEVLEKEFKLSSGVANFLLQNVLFVHLSQLKEQINLVIETHYIDKVYRDSYYNYYSSKLNRYKRNCIKISFFDTDVHADDFMDFLKTEMLKANYLGFLILRPTEPAIIGRSMISPKALRENNIQICAASISSTANAIKFESHGFPHSSQDAETITCAETTIWALMEYFGHKYPEYKPVLPSKIHSILHAVSFQRLLPSKGLDVNQLSYALRELGFGTKIYSREEYGASFDNLLSTYVESGIPVVIAVDNRQHFMQHPDDFSVDYIGHALLCIGHVNTQDRMIESLKEVNPLYPGINIAAKRNNVKIFDYNDIAREYVFIDDNQPVYQKAFLQNPTKHYNSTSWEKCEISHFIVPLYRKIYLEAYQVKNFILGLLLESPHKIQNDSEITIRTFLASTRSYKQYVALNSSLNPDVRRLVIEEKFPKFIWVTELSTKELLKKKQAFGLVILDATEPNTFHFEPLILAAFAGVLIKYSSEIRKLEKFPLPLQPFSMCESNLKSFV